MTDQIICGFLAAKYGSCVLATLVACVLRFAAQQNKHVPPWWFAHNNQEKTHAFKCQSYAFGPDYTFGAEESCAFSSFHRSITPIGMAAMAPDSGMDAVFDAPLLNTGRMQNIKSSGASL